ncbi:MAG: 7-cyano-7-deazaguanine synthase [Candidatus Poseidoniales archaeon]
MALGNLEQKVAIALVSGGIDSPVAVARMLADGWTIHALHASQEPITGPEAENKTLTSLQHLNSIYSGLLHHELVVVPVAEALTGFTNGDAHRDYFVHMKRLFQALASLLAKEVGATHILSGENLGQVSSQTLGNMGAVEVASSLPVLRPLLGLDKQEIIAMARAIGTYEISVGPEECDALGPKHPTTIANLERLYGNEGGTEGLMEIASKCWLSSRRRLL